ncbi:MAG: D-amino-acid transaminase [Pseudomonadota bacterium]
MSRIVYVNGAFEPEEEAKVSVFDRGFLFGDAVYEVTAVLGGGLVDFEAHLSRLDRSLREIEIPRPMPDEGFRELHETLIAENDLDEGIVYLHVSRGSADRDFAYPPAPSPSVVAFTQARAIVNHPQAETGVAVITIPDIRWKRRDIKSTSMLAQAMGKQEAKMRGAYEAWMVEDGFVTEGTSSSAFIVDENGVLRTQPLGPHILPGVTRRAILRLAQEDGIPIEERPFSVEEAYGAREAMMTAASAFVLPIVTIDGRTIGSGTPGPIARAFRAHYIAEARAAALPA